MCPIYKTNHKLTDEFKTVNCQQYKGQWGHTKQQVHKSSGSTQSNRSSGKKTKTKNSYMKHELRCITAT